MRVLVFQHTPEEVPGSLLPWLKKRNLSHQIFHTYEGSAFPRPEEFDWLIVLGGPMNVDETHIHPWLLKEKEFISHWLKTEKPYLGICLGGQLLAQCLGAKVKKNTVREIGLWPMTKTESQHPFFESWPITISVFQWHEDTFELPQNCTSYFTSPACANQAFSVGKNRIGLQFHPEAEIPWILGNYSDFQYQASETYVQSKEECEKKFSLIPDMEKNFHDLLDQFLK